MNRTSQRIGLGPNSELTGQRDEPRRTRVEPLESRCVMTAPTWGAALPDVVSVAAGSTLHLALDGFDADGDNLTYGASVSAADAARLQASVPTGNRSLVFHLSHTASSDPADVSFTGDLRMQLFEDLAPRTTARILELVNENFYNNVIFHRIIPGFVVQGGDPTGTGTGGSGEKFDDEYHADARHSTAGVFSMAKSLDDSNDSQFFMTLAATPSLDFQHSVFGVRTQQDASINFLVPRNGDKPKGDIKINSVDVIVDQENGVLRLKATPGATGSVTVTVTMSDGTTTVTDTIVVNITSSPNTPPHFGNIPNIQTNAGQPVTVNLPIIDLENNDFEITGEKFSNNLNATFNATTGQVTITPVAGFFGVDALRFYVAPRNAFASVPSGPQPFQQRVAAIEPFVDSQAVAVLVDPPAPTISLLTDSGAADNVTNANNSTGKPLKFRVSGVFAGHKVDLRDGAGNLLGSKVATGTSVDFDVPTSRVFGDGPLTVRATQTMTDTFPGDDSQVFTLESEAGQLNITIDTSNSPFDSTPVTEAIANTAYTYNAHTTGEGQGSSAYSLLTKPTGMTINATTGEITWTPSLSQANNNQVVIQFVDGVGNISTQSFTIGVQVPPVLELIPDQVGFEGTFLEFQVTATDANMGTGGIGDSLLYTFVGQPLGASIDPQTGRVLWIPDETLGGTSVNLTILVRDSRGLTDSQIVKITWNETNQAPVITEVDDLTVVSGGQVTANVLANDLDVPAQGLVFSIDPSNTTPGASINSSTGVFVFNAGTLAPGQYQVVVRATETGIANPLFATRTITINVVANGPPVINPIGTQTVRQGETLTVNVVAADPDQPPRSLVYSLAQGSPAGMTINAQTGRITFTPATNFPVGSQTITVIVTEDGPNPESAQRSFTLNVTERLNEPPSVEQIDVQTVAQRKTLSIQVVATDPEGERALTYELVGTVPDGASINANTGLLTFSPGASFPTGQVIISVRVTEVGDNPKSTTASFAVNVTSNPNVAPTIGAIAQRGVVRGQSVSFGIPASDIDDPASTLVYALLGNPPAGASIDPNTGQFAFSPDASFAVGPVTFQVQVTEAGANPLSATATFTVQVNDVNQPPVIGAISAKTVVAGGTLSFAIQGSDPDDAGAVLSYALVGSLPAGASIDPNTGLFTYNPPAGTAAGPVSFTVQVSEMGTNPLATTATFAVDVTAPPNAPPVIGAVGPRTVKAGQATAFAIVANDPDGPGAALLYSLLGQVPAGASIDPGTGLFSYTPPLGTPAGPISFTVQVTETGANPLSATATFAVTVVVDPIEPINNPPQFGPIAVQSVVAGETIAFTLAAIDPDNPTASLSFSLVGSSMPGADIDPATGEFTFAPAAGTAAGDYAFTVRVTEAGGLATETTFVVSVAASEEFDITGFFPFIGYQLDSRGTTVVNLGTPEVPSVPSFVIPAGAPVVALGQDFVAATVNRSLPAVQRLNLGPDVGVSRIVDPATLPGFQVESAADRQGETSGAPVRDENVVPAGGQSPIDEGSPPATDERSEGQPEPTAPVAPAAAAAALLEELGLDVDRPAWRPSPAGDAVGRWAEETYLIGEAVGRFDPDLLDLDLQMGVAAAVESIGTTRAVAQAAREPQLDPTGMAAEIAMAVRHMAESRQADLHARRAAFDEQVDINADDEIGPLETTAAAALGFYMPLLVTDLAETKPASRRRRRR